MLTIQQGLCIIQMLMFQHLMLEQKMFKIIRFVKIIFSENRGV